MEVRRWSLRGWWWRLRGCSLGLRGEGWRLRGCSLRLKGGG